MPATAAYRARARQWSKMACAIGLLFGSLPVISRLFFGAWGFDGAAEIACVFLIAAAYFYIVSRRIPFLRDAAAMLDEAGALAASGRLEQAVALLTKTIHQNPHVWQAYQYRGQLYLQLGQPACAFEDFSEAVLLAPEEPVLQALRNQAQELME